MHPDRTVLACTRVAIDAVDDGMLVLLSLRRRLARHAGRIKGMARLPAVDRDRESAVRLRTQRLARKLDVPAAAARALADLAIGDARRLQGIPPDPDHGEAGCAHGTISGDMDHDRSHRTPAADRARRWLRLLPPPRRWAPVMRACPRGLQREWMERAMARALAQPLADDAFAFLHERRLGIEVADLGLAWVVTLRDGRLRVVDGGAEASVRGSATDLLLLASRLEDADTLFFQRRLVLTGDTELGLTARNVLDRLPWEQVPLALRILLNRGACFAQAARTAHHATRAPERQA